MYGIHIDDLTAYPAESRKCIIDGNQIDCTTRLHNPHSIALVDTSDPITIDDSRTTTLESEMDAAEARLTTLETEMDSAEVRITTLENSGGGGATSNPLEVHSTSGSARLTPTSPEQRLRFS